MVATASIADRRLLLFTTILSAGLHLWLGIAVLRETSAGLSIFAPSVRTEVPDDVPIEIADIIDQLPEEQPPEPPPLRLGIAESEGDTRTWLGFAEPEEHLVPIASEVEQAALTPDDVGGMMAGSPESPGIDPAPERTEQLATASPSSTPSASESNQTETAPQPTSDTTPPEAIRPELPEPAGARPIPLPPSDSPEQTLRERAEPVQPEPQPEIPPVPSDEVLEPSDEPADETNEGDQAPAETPPPEPAPAPAAGAEEMPAEDAKPTPPSGPPQDIAPAADPIASPVPAPQPSPIESANEGEPVPGLVPASGDGRPADATEPESTVHAPSAPAPALPPAPASPVDPAQPSVPPEGPISGPTSGNGMAPGLGEGEALRRGLRSDKESPASSLKRAIKYHPGKPLAVQGLEVRTVEPRFPVAVRLTSSPRNPVIVIHFDRRGVVTRAEFLKDEEKKLIYNTGTSAMDEPLLTAIYQWRAKGRELDALPADDPEATVSFVMEIFLRR